MYSGLCILSLLRPVAVLCFVKLTCSESSTKFDVCQYKFAKFLGFLWSLNPVGAGGQAQRARTSGSLESLGSGPEDWPSGRCGLRPGVGSCRDPGSRPGWDAGFPEGHCPCVYGRLLQSPRCIPHLETAPPEAERRLGSWADLRYNAHGGQRFS